MTDRFNDAALVADAASTAPGIRRRAEILLTVPVEMRDAVVQEAHYRCNISGGRPSDALAAVIGYAPAFTSPSAIEMWREVCH